jgi:hypothetical protein
MPDLYMWISGPDTTEDHSRDNSIPLFLFFILYPEALSGTFNEKKVS